MIELLQADVQMTLHAEISLSRNKLPLLAVSESKAYTISWDFCLSGLVSLPDFFFLIKHFAANFALLFGFQAARREE